VHNRSSDTATFLPRAEGTEEQRHISPVAFGSEVLWLKDPEDQRFVGWRCEIPKLVEHEILRLVNGFNAGLPVDNFARKDAAGL